MPFCNVCLPNWFHLKCLFTKTALIGFSCKHSFMQRQSKDIWKCLFAKIIKECMQETPYNFPIKVSLLCIILPTKHKSGYDISLFFHPKVSFQCIIMPSTTKESLQYIYIFTQKESLFFLNNLFRRNKFWKFCKACFGGMEFLQHFNSKKESFPFFIICMLWINDWERARTLLM